MMKRVILIPLALLIGAAAGCAPGVTDGEPTGIPEATTPAAAIPESAPAATTAAPEATAAIETPAAGPSAGEVPQEYFDAVMEDALALSSATQADVVVEKSEQVQWSDGSLGCPQPDTMYTMAIVEGYQIVLNIGGEVYDYRLGDGGWFFRCENALPGVPIGGTPSE